MSEVISTMEKGTVEENRRFSQVHIFTLDFFTELQNIYPDTNMTSPLCVCETGTLRLNSIFPVCYSYQPLHRGFRPEEFGWGSAR